MRRAAGAGSTAGAEGTEGPHGWLEELRATCLQARKALERRLLWPCPVAARCHRPSCAVPPRAVLVLVLAPGLSRELPCLALRRASSWPGN